jgi:type IV secretion system protein VirD4
VSRPPLGRRVWGPLAWGPTLRLPARHSLLVVGPTQSGKTSSLVVPALLEWSGPAVVTSVKADVVTATRAWREALGETLVLEPGRDGGCTWDLREAATSMRTALRVVRDLALPGRGDAEFWNALATKLVAALLVAGRALGRDATEVARALEARDLASFLEAREAPDATEVVEGFLGYESRTLDSVTTTAETMLLPWRLAQPTREVGGVVEGAHTLYLCSPRAEQIAYQPLLRAAIRCVLEAQQRAVDAGRARELLLVLDEAALVAPLEDLDELAATLVGMGVTLVTVVQDLSQLRARYGERAATIVNNHATRLVLTGLADPALSRYLPELAPREGPALRTGRVGRARVLSGHRPVVEVAPRPWWRARRLRRRGESPAT